ncbi:hypothetical protein NQ315_003101 [Exocentrus adspersus]|uniref:Uncharacterized protein n=1 Tax=Exocentrus adspersus TaxID=1586481 RepID=A0AAV8W4X2_9CUCU|nr:hypothetical protein NQ315_003101 [Exocentrus adspersus]
MKVNKLYTLTSLALEGLLLKSCNSSWNYNCINMNLLYPILCVLLQLTASKAAPTDRTLYDVLANKCSYLNLTDTSFKNQPTFQKCKDWQSIDKTKAVRKDTEENILCLLYYDSFVSFCTESETLKANVTTKQLLPDLKYDVNTVCKDLALLPTGKKFEHNIRLIINNESICKKLCLDYTGQLVPECGYAYYFTNSLNKTDEGTESVSKAKPKAQGSEGNLLSEVAHAVNAITGGNKVPSLNIQPSNPAMAKNVDKEQGEQAVQANQAEGAAVAPAVPETPVNAKPNVTLKVTPKLSNVQSNSNDEADAGVEDVNPLGLDVVNNAPQQVPEAETGNVEKTGTVKETKTGTAEDTETAADKGTQTGAAKSTLKETHGEVSAVGEPVKAVEGKDEAAAVEQQSALDTPEQMLEADRDMEEEEVNDDKDEEEKPAVEEKKKEKPSKLTAAGGMPANLNTTEDLDGESYFFSYFMVVCLLFVLGYVGYHNRQKVMALMLEGKRGRRPVRSRRPNSANYHKLDSNLEEAISSSCTKNSTHIIY